MLWRPLCAGKLAVVGSNARVPSCLPGCGQGHQPDAPFRPLQALHARAQTQEKIKLIFHKSIFRTVSLGLGS